MPIYAYRCSACGHAQDVLQKISDDVLTVCPACGDPSFVKQVTAAGFQLKGSGWYVTDFRGGNAGAKETPKEAAAEGAKEGAKTGTAAGDGDGAKSAPAPAGKSPLAAPAAEAAKPASAAPPPAAPKAGA